MGFAKLALQKRQEYQNHDLQDANQLLFGGYNKVILEKKKVFKHVAKFQ